MEGWIKSYRKFQQWEWYSTPNMFHLFHHLLYIASHKDSRWKGIEIKRGQAITGLNALRKNTGISTQSLRTCINKLKSTGEITIKSTNRYSIITICNYDIYQPTEDFVNNQTNNPDNKQLTSNQQTTNNIQELREDKKVEKLRIKKAEILKKQIEEDNLIREKETEMFIENLLSGKY